MIKSHLEEGGQFGRIQPDEHRSVEPMVIQRERPTLDEIERVIQDPFAREIVAQRLRQEATVRPCSWSEFRAELEAVYSCKAKATWAKHRQVLDLLEAAVEQPADLTDATVAKLAKQWLEAPREPATVNSLLRTLRTQCNDLVRRQCLERSPFDGPRSLFLREPVPTSNHLTVRQIQRLLDRLDAEAQQPLFEKEHWRARRLRALIVLVLYTGVRGGEALRVRRDDVDFEQRIVWVTDRDANTKTAASRDFVPLADACTSTLQEWCQELAGEYVFPQITRDRPWLAGGPGYKPIDEVRAIGGRAGIERLSLLRLRHTWSTHAESLWGLSEAQIQRVLRHTNPRTQQRYRHADAENLVSLVRHHDFRLIDRDGNSKEVS